MFDVFYLFLVGSAVALVATIITAVAVTPSDYRTRREEQNV